MLKSRNILFLTLVVSVLGFSIFGTFLFKEVSANLLYGAKSYFAISEIPNGLTKSDAEAQIKQAVTENNVNAFLIYKGGSNGVNSVAAYAFIGDNSTFQSNLENDRYQSFDPSFTVEIKQTDQIGDHSLIGTYQTSADESTVKKIVQDLKNHGITANYRYYGSSVYIAQFFFILFQHNLFLLFYAILIALFFTQVYSIVSRGKEQVAYVTNGFSNIRILFVTLKNHVKYYLAALAISLPIVLVFLFFYNHWHLLTDLLLILLIMYAVLFVTIVFVVFFAVSILSLKPNFVELVKGKTHNRFINFATVATQILLSIILFVFAASSSTNTLTLLKNLSEFSVYENVKSYDYFTLGPRINESSANEHLGKFFRSLDKSGRLMFVERNVINLGDLSDADEKSSSLNNYKVSNSLIVNNAYLSAQNIIKDDGSTINSLPSNSIYVLLPEDKLELQGRVVEKAEQAIRELSFESSDQIPPPKVILTQKNQELSNFNTGRDPNMGPLLNPTTSATDPIILVIPDTSQMLSDSVYLSWASKSSVLVDNSSQDLESLIKESSVQQYITSTNNVIDGVTNQIEESKLQLQLVLVALILSFLIFIFSTYVLTIVHFNKFKRIIFAKLTNGLTFWQINSKFIILTSAIPLLSVICTFLAIGGSVAFAFAIILVLVAVSATTSSVSALVLNQKLLKDFQQL
ncbi:MAG: hypothetical protein LBB10_01170 [Bifidobacteriaceae bacterium]|jgi:hypothetical protein|nr:hypothetical protein [Bifidobacteriaceae bacterium]